MAFDLIRFFDARGLPYSTAGTNVSKGNVVIHCPFCGSSDEGQHLSVSISGDGWRCWRHPDHRGRSPVRLIAALLGISIDAAKQIVGSSYNVPDDFFGRMQTMLARRKQAGEPAPYKLDMPKSFRRFEGQPSSRPYERYLFQRHYRHKDIDTLTRKYGLRYCTAGPYHGRIIFPIRYEGALVSWTGRAVGNATLRYKSLSDDPDKAADEGLPPALGKLTDYLLWFDKLLRGGDALFLCEGPFDALAVMMAGRRHGIMGTCCFTASPSSAQEALLHTVAPRFKRRFVLLDNGAQHVAMRLVRQLHSLGFEQAILPRAFKDPAEMPRQPRAKFLIDCYQEAA